MKTRHTAASLTLAVAGVAGVVGIHAAGASGQARDDHQQFVLVQTSVEDDASRTLYAVGPITGVGVDTELSATRDEIAFADGTVTIEHTTRHEDDDFDPSTCRLSFSENGTYRIVGGTGAYEGVDGHGNYTLRAGATDACDESGPPSNFVAIIDAEGTVTR
jgi:hypothetical protein